MSRTTAKTTPDTDPMIGLMDVLNTYLEGCISRATAYRMRKRGEFVPHMRLSPGRTVYRTSDVKAWIAARRVSTAKG